MIVIYPDPRLRVTTLSRGWDLDTERVAEKTQRELAKAGNGIGLAAPQVGEKARLFVVKGLALAGPVGDKHGLELVFEPRFKPLDWKVYPYYQHHDEKEPFLEGCLSLPGLWGAVRRHLQIQATWKTWQEGRLVDKKAELTGLAAIVFQHELDHLNGVLFIDHIRQANGKVYRLKNGRQKEVALPADDRLLAESDARGN